MATRTEAQKYIASNRKARFDYTILDVFEAGIVLQGSEVKVLRMGHLQIADAYARTRALVGAPMPELPGQDVLELIAAMLGAPAQ